MNASYTEAGLLAYVDGFGQDILAGLSETDFDREIKYIAVARAAYASNPLIPVLIDEISINHKIPCEVPQPSIHGVEDFSYEVGTSGHVIEWAIGNFTPSSYELYRDGGLIASSSWPGGTVIDFDIDNLEPRTYNYTIIVFGENEISVSDTVLVTVIDSISPSIGHPVDIVYEYGSEGHSIVWSASDLYPDDYTIQRNGVFLDSDSWSSGSITLDIDGLALGSYVYTILVSDTSGNNAYDSVHVSVTDTTSPFINHPSDVHFELGTENIQIIWQPVDLLPFDYEVYLDGTLVSSGTWISGENITYTLAEILGLGTYNITIAARDTSNNYAIDTVIISIEGSSRFFGDYLVITIAIGSLAAIVIIAGLILRNRATPQSVNPSGYRWQSYRSMSL